MGHITLLGGLLNFVLLGMNWLGNRGDNAPPPPPTPTPTPITSESLGALQGDGFRALLPEDIRAKPYLKDVNTFGDFVKKFDGSQVLLGQRASPEETADPTQWDAFHAKVRPASADKYAMPQVEGVPAEYIQKLSESKDLRNLLFTAGASQHQAKVFLSGIIKALHTAETNVTTARDASFTKMVTTVFGDKKDAILANGKAYLAANLPDAVKPLLGQMDDNQLAVVIAVIDTTVKKFSGEDPFRGGGGGGGGGGETKDSLVAQMQTIMKDPVYNDPFKDKVKNKELNDKMDVIRGKLKKLQAGN